MSSALPQQMQCIEISAPGKPEVLKSATRALPAPTAGEVLIKVAAAGVNGPDMMQRKGLYPAPPGASDLLGLEISGEVVALGEGVTRWKTGDHITALTNGGGYAEYCAVDAQHCLELNVRGNTVIARCDGIELFRAEQTRLTNGGAGYAVESGSIFVGKTSIRNAPAGTVKA